MYRKNVVPFCIGIGLVATFCALLVWFNEKYRPRYLTLQTSEGLPASVRSDERLVIRTPDRQLLGELARYDNELFAWLMFDYVRSQPAFRDRAVLLAYSSESKSVVYRLEVVLPNDWITGFPQLYELAAPFPFFTPTWLIVDDRVLNEQKLQTKRFVDAYSSSASAKVLHFSRKEIAAYTQQFIRFKSTTDSRIRRRIEPVPQALSEKQAQNLADDIVAVADFYRLPLDFFLGIGAMENNYLDVKGDLLHAVWKRRPAQGDVVVRRRGNRVLVSNEALGAWQITKETLRYAHSLFLRDDRDYSKLPAPLRPSRKLDMRNPDSRVLTTYAGLLFRDLLDQFGGDVAVAVGAYNGGPRKPNAKYAEGVRVVADYAGRTLDAVAELRGRTVAEQAYLRNLR